MPDTTYASSNMESLGRNKDSSGVYFDKDGNPLAKTTFTKPTTDISGAVKDFENQFFQNPSAKLEGSTYSVLKTDLTSSSFMLSLKGIDHLGKETDIPYGIYLRDSVTFNGKKTTRGNEPTWIYTKAELNDYISSASKAWLDMANKDKEEAEKKVALQAASYVKGTNDEVDKVCSLLGLSTADAIAYLAAGGSVEKAAKQITEWNLASPSQRKALIASQGKNFNASEYKSNIILPPIVYKAKSPEDLYKGIRNPYNERNATKSYIALVKETSKLKDQNDKTPTLLTLKEFYMQSVSELDSEKYQIVETFNKPKIYFFDRRARIYQYSFIVENVGLEDINLDPKYNVKSEIDKYKKRGNLWRDLFKNTYDLYLRGTKCVENRVKAVIHYDEVTRIGYILSCSMNMDAQNENVASVQITMFVEDEQQRNVLPVVNLEALKNELLKQATKDPKKTVQVPFFSDKNSKMSQKELVLSETINVVNYTETTINKPSKPFKLKLKDCNIDNSDISVPTSGEVLIEKITIDGADGKDSLALINGKDHLSSGESVFVGVEGIDLYPFVDSSSKFISSLSGQNKVLFYNILFTSKEDSNRKCLLSGSITVKKRSNIIKSNQLDKLDNKMRYTEIKWDLFKKGEISNDLKTKSFKGEFEIYYFDEVSGLQQDFPVDLIPSVNLKVDNIKGSINKQDQSYLNSSCVFTRIDSKKFKCEVTVNANINSETQNLEFTAESCVLKGIQKIGDANFDFRVNFIRAADEQEWIFFGAKSLKYPDTLRPLFNQTVWLMSVFDLYFDKDPGEFIEKEIVYNSSLKFNVSAEISQEEGFLSSSKFKLNQDIVLSGAGDVYSVNGTTTAKLSVIERKKVKAKDVDIKGLSIDEKTEDLFLVRIQTVHSSNLNYWDIVKIMYGTRSKETGFSIDIYAYIGSIGNTESFSIAKTKYKSIPLVSEWVNINKTVSLQRPK